MAEVKGVKDVPTIFPAARSALPLLAIGKFGHIGSPVDLILDFEKIPKDDTLGTGIPFEPSIPDILGTDISFGPSTPKACSGVAVSEKENKNVSDSERQHRKICARKLLCNNALKYCRMPVISVNVLPSERVEHKQVERENDGANVPEIPKSTSVQLSPIEEVHGAYFMEGREINVTSSAGLEESAFDSEKVALSRAIEDDVKTIATVFKNWSRNAECDAFTRVCLGTKSAQKRRATGDTAAYRPIINSASKPPRVPKRKKRKHPEGRVRRGERVEARGDLEGTPKRHEPNVRLEQQGSVVNSRPNQNLILSVLTRVDRDSNRPLSKSSNHGPRQLHTLPDCAVSVAPSSAAASCAQGTIRQTLTDLSPSHVIYGGSKRASRGSRLGDVGSTRANCNRSKRFATNFPHENKDRGAVQSSYKRELEGIHPRRKKPRTDRKR